MKRILTLLTFMPMLMSAGVPDSVFVKVVTRGNDTKNLYLDWSADGQTWNEALGAITKSDYGAWGSGKNLFNPTISIDDNGLATITLDVKADGSTNGITYTTDFVNYKPQDYYDRQARPLEEGRGQVVKLH